MWREVSGRAVTRPAGCSKRAAIFAARLVTPLLAGKLRWFRPVHARTVASAMVAAAKLGGVGRQVYAFDDIVRLSAEPAAG